MPANEVAWTRWLAGQIADALPGRASGGGIAKVEVGRRLTYAVEAAQYPSDGKPVVSARGYQTDILIADHSADGSWIPRIVIECKLGQVTTHDALTYSMKATTHKHVHPYLRYGAMVGGLSEPLPTRLVRHGLAFDFIVTWARRRPTVAEWRRFVVMIRDELRASRTLQTMLSDRTRSRRRFRWLHKPLRLG